MQTFPETQTLTLASGNPLLAGVVGPVCSPGVLPLSIPVDEADLAEAEDCHGHEEERAAAKVQDEAEHGVWSDGRREWD